MVHWLASGETGSILEIETGPRQARIGTKKAVAHGRTWPTNTGCVLAPCWWCSGGEARLACLPLKGGCGSGHPPQGAVVSRTRQLLVCVCRLAVVA